MKHIGYWLTGLILFFYAPLAMIPAEWLWYDPGIPTFSDTVYGEPVSVYFTRDIKTETFASYAAVLRNAGDGEPVCDGFGGPFQYKPTRGPKAIVDKNFHWWMGKSSCPDQLLPGTYSVETTWLVRHPLGDYLPEPFSQMLGWIIPAKTVTRISPVFTVTPVKEVL